MPFVSVLIVTQSRVRDLERCLQSVERSAILASGNPGFSHEIIVVINGHCPDTTNLLAQFPRVIQMTIDRCSPAAARNQGVLKASGEFVFFLDDDAAVPGDYFRQAKVTFESFSGLEILGGPDATFPDGNLREQAIGLALMSPLATGKTRLRHGSARKQSGRVRAQAFRASEDALILCNLWIRRTLFEVEGHRFNEFFWRNEENVLLRQLAGRKAMHDPDLFVYHRRKTRWIQFLKANFFSGYFRAKSFWCYPRSIRPHFFAPSAFLLLPVFVSLGNGAWGMVWAIVMLLYLALNLLFSIRSVVRIEQPVGISPSIAVLLVLLVMIYQMVITAAYGVGFLVGAASVKSIS
jgi:glycosyltransferase involved in cell wall biosynthesis